MTEPFCHRLIGAMILMRLSRRKTTPQPQRTMIALPSSTDPSRRRQPWRLPLALTTLAVVAAAAIITHPYPALAQETDDTPDPRQEGLPLAAARTISTSFTEGSWMSIDVSPDGQTLVFDFLGDLYTMPITGGSVPATCSWAPHRWPAGARPR